VHQFLEAESLPVRASARRSPADELEPSVSIEFTICEQTRIRSANRSAHENGIGKTFLSVSLNLALDNFQLSDPHVG
jgi:hypothetical protein